MSNQNRIVGIVGGYPRGYRLQGIPSSRGVEVGPHIMINFMIIGFLSSNAILAEEEYSDTDTEDDEPHDLQPHVADCLFVGETLHDVPCCDRKLVEQLGGQRGQKMDETMCSVAGGDEQDDYVFVFNPLKQEKDKLDKAYRAVFPDLYHDAQKRVSHTSAMPLSRYNKHNVTQRFPDLGLNGQLLRQNIAKVPLASTRSCVRLAKPDTMLRPQLEAAAAGVEYKHLRPHLDTAIGLSRSGPSEITRTTVTATVTDFVGAIAPQADTYARMMLEFLSEKKLGTDLRALLNEFHAYQNETYGLHGSFGRIHIDSRNAQIMCLALLCEQKYQKAMFDLYEMATGGRGFDPRVVAHLELCRCQVAAYLGALPIHKRGTALALLKSGKVIPGVTDTDHVSSEAIFEVFSQPQREDRKEGDMSDEEEYDEDEMEAEEEEGRLRYQNTTERDTAAIARLVQKVADARPEEDVLGAIALEVQNTGARLALSARAWEALEEERARKRNTMECLLDNVMARVTASTLDHFGSSALPGFGSAVPANPIVFLTQERHDLSLIRNYLSRDLRRGIELRGSQQGMKNAYTLHKYKFWQLYFA